MDTPTVIARDETPFRLDAVAVGSRRTFWLDVCPLASGALLRLPLLIVRGLQAGPTLVVLGGVHGDEYEGMAAVRDVLQSLDPATLRGTVLGVPLCNPPAFAGGTRVNPLDGLNLARVFPGRADGTITEQIAHVIDQQVLSHADFLIDLHSSGSRMSMPLLVGYFHGDSEAGRRSEAAARRFGVPIIWGHRDCTVGRTLSGPHARGIPWLYTESPSGGWLDQDIAAIYARGVHNVLTYLGQPPGDAPVTPLRHELVGAGDTDRGLAAPAGGFLRPVVPLLSAVAANDLLGTIEDPFGTIVAELRAPAAGMLMMRHEAANVEAGDVVFLLT